jgi:diketogulonate reductase-like aldo/keto reductase
MKKNYRVKLNEIHISSWDVEANSEQEAVNRAIDGDGEMIDCEYSYTPAPNEKFVTHAVHCVTLEL